MVTAPSVPTILKEERCGASSFPARPSQPALGLCLPLQRCYWELQGVKCKLPITAPDRPYHRRCKALALHPATSALTLHPSTNLSKSEAAGFCSRITFFLDTCCEGLPHEQCGTGAPHHQAALWPFVLALPPPAACIALTLSCQLDLAN